MAYVGLVIAPEGAADLTVEPCARFHLTLAHFAKPEAEQRTLLAHSLRTLAASAPAPALEYLRSEPWPSGWVLLVRRMPVLMALQDEVEAILRGLHIAPTKDHDWTPHISIGTANFAGLEMNVSPTLTTHALELCGCTAITRFEMPFVRRSSVRS